LLLTPHTFLARVLLPPSIVHPSPLYHFLSSPLFFVSLSVLLTLATRFLLLTLAFYSFFTSRSPLSSGCFPSHCRMSLCSRMSRPREGKIHSPAVSNKHRKKMRKTSNTLSNFSSMVVVLRWKLSFQRRVIFLHLCLHGHPVLPWILAFRTTSSD
jgi:hypothetical protein